jgi:hypothetical protein
VTREPPAFVLDFQVSRQQSIARERSARDIPDAGIECFEPDLCARASMGDMAPVATPANPAIGTDRADLAPVRVVERRKLRGQRAC